MATRNPTKEDRWLNHKFSATELRLQICIYIVNGYCYATVLLSKDQRQNSYIQRFLFSVFLCSGWLLKPLSKQSLVRFPLAIKFLILYCRKKACKRRENTPNNVAQYCHGTS